MGLFTYVEYNRKAKYYIYMGLITQILAFFGSNAPILSFFLAIVVGEEYQNFGDEIPITGDGRNYE